MTDAAKIARGLTKAQQEALLECDRWDVEVGAGIEIAFIRNGLIEESNIICDGVQLTPLGLAVRAELERNNHD